MGALPPQKPINVRQESSPEGPNTAEGKNPQDILIRDTIQRERERGGRGR